MRKHFVLAIAMVFAGVFGYASSAFAQAGAATAQLNGTVTDASGGSVAGATVTLRNTATNTTSTATTSNSGFYSFANLAPGDYELKTSFSGFANYTQKGIELSVGQSATINVALAVASQGEKVVVTSEAQVIEPTKTEISQVVESQKIESLPISGRLFTDFALLTPGVATSRTGLGSTITEFEVTQISFGGMRSFSNEITVDGADFVNTITGVQRATPPQDSVQEFRVVNNSFGAEYGRAAGGIVNIVTKSGTNDLHGSVYDYFQNNVTNSRSILQKPPLQTDILPDELRHNQFGGSLGGPISKDKTFFFANYEGKRRAESPNVAPDLLNNLTNFDTAKRYLGLSPEGCTKVPTACTGSDLSYLDSTLKTANNDYGFARLDHQINASNRLAIRYNVEDARDGGELIGQTLDGGGISTPSGGRNLFIRDQSVVGTVDTILKPNLVNTALVQYARRHYNFQSVTGEPDLSVVHSLESGRNFGISDQTYETRMQGSDSVSWVKGNHIAKFGFDGNYVWGMNNFPGFTPGNIRFANFDCLYEYANFIDFGGGPAIPANYGNCPDAAFQGVNITYWGVALPRANCPDIQVNCGTGAFYNGIPAPAATGAGFDGGWPHGVPVNLFSNYQYKLNHGYWGVFAQDQWRINPKLTLNFGLRWDYESGLDIQIDRDYNEFQPRVGLAYSPDSKTVIRAGYGIFFDRQNMSFFYIPGGQKDFPNGGLLCNGVTTDPTCDGVTPIQLPMVRNGAENAGWQVSALPGFAATIPAGCTPEGAGVVQPQGGALPPCPPEIPTGVLSVAGLIGAGILAGEDYPPTYLTGQCAGGTRACGTGAGGVDRHIGRAPYAHQASLQITHQFGGGFSGEIGYLFVGAHKLVRGNNINVPCPAGTSKPDGASDAQGLLNANGTLSPCTGTPTLGPLGLGPIFQTLDNPTGLEFGGAPFNTGDLSGGLIDYNNNVANAIYHGLSVTAQERWSKYFNLTANYTYSHTVDNGNFTTFINLPVNQFDYGTERANSNQDVRHHLVTNFTASTPNSGWYRNFQFSSIITLQSGRPFTIFSGEDTLGDLIGLSTDRTGGPPIVPNCESVQHCSTLVPRNTYIGQPLYTWDFRLSRAFHLTEGLKLDLMVDAFNALNRGNIDEVNSIYGPVFCGDTPAIPRHFNDATTRAVENGLVSCASQQAAANPGAWLGLGLIPHDVPDAPNSSFGVPRTVFNPRQFQFAAKFSF